MKNLSAASRSLRIRKTQAIGRGSDFRAWVRLLAIAWTLIGVTVLRAQNSTPTDYDVKAAYLYNFGRFVDWPTQVEGEHFTVCVLGQDPFGPRLDSTLAGETIGGKSIIAKRISSSQESDDCRIVFLSPAENGRLKKIVAELDKKSILTVSDMPKFTQLGGMIQFVVEGKRVRFEVNLTATQRAGLTLSSELLKVATAVKRNAAVGD